MNRTTSTTGAEPGLRYPGGASMPTAVAPAADASRVLRNTYALLAMTLLCSAGVAAMSVARPRSHSCRRD